MKGPLNLPWYVRETRTGFSVNSKGYRGQVCRMSITPQSNRSDDGRASAALIVERVNGWDALMSELQAYRDAARYDVQMSGPKPMGWDLSQLERAREMTEAARAAGMEEKGNG